MNDTTYQYNVYNPRYDEYYILNSDTQLTKGTWVMDIGDSVQVQAAYRTITNKKAYQPTNTIEYTIYPELSLLIATLIFIAFLIRWIIRMQKVPK